MTMLRVFLLAPGLASGLLVGADLPTLRAEAYLGANAVDWRAIVPAPPAEGSIVAEAELETVRNLQEARTAQLVALAKQYDDISVFSVLRPVLGPNCTPERCPKTAAFFKQATADLQPTIEAAKAAWFRRRPYLQDPNLVPVVYRPTNTSYPSGHSALAAAYAVALTELLPAHAADWERQAMLVRWSRVVGGAHFPSDTVAGQHLGEALGRALARAEKFRADAQGVIAELTSVQAMEPRSQH